jgi:phosphoenolpyruvate-protein kinase (PTS system EI component)
MTERILAGLGASPGIAAGSARVLDAAVSAEPGSVASSERAAEASRAAAALDAAAIQILTLAAELEGSGKRAEAEIVETGALMAADPGLVAAVRSAVLDQGSDAPGAILAATETYAATLAALDDPVLRLRADDVRSLGRRAARLAAGTNGTAPADQHDDLVLVARELGPADVAELAAGVKGIALAAGGVMAHAAIVARSLGIPMVVGAGDEVLAVEPGEALVVDGDDGSVAIAPAPERLHRAQLAAARRRRAHERSAAERTLPAATVDGHRIRVLSNVATPAEVEVGLGSGAEGVGLFRTELGLLDAPGWPAADEHRRVLAPVLDRLAGMTATVRLLDFGGDKTPPFLSGTDQRGIGLLLAHPVALDEQLGAVVSAGRDTDLRILLPMVELPDQVEAVRARLDAIEGGSAVALGAMIETVGAAERAAEIAAVADFLSIGTNDLTHSALGTERFGPGESLAHHPAVLRLIAAVVDAAAGAGLLVEVCGEAASDPVTMPVLLGLGVDELSVGAARVGSVRAWVRALRFDDTRALARHALELRGAFEVAEELGATARLLAELDDAAGERLESGPGVVALGGQP